MATSIGPSHVFFGFPPCIHGGEFMIRADFRICLPLPCSGAHAIGFRQIILVMVGSFLYRPPISPFASARQIHRLVVGMRSMSPCAIALCLFRPPTVSPLRTGGQHHYRRNFIVGRENDLQVSAAYALYLFDEVFHATAQ